MVLWKESYLGHFFFLIHKAVPKRAITRKIQSQKIYNKIIDQILNFKKVPKMTMISPEVFQYFIAKL